MTLWIVRWPGVGASLVAAESEEEPELVLAYRPPPRK
jgi:hypothetical protein